MYTRFCRVEELHGGDRGIGGEGSLVMGVSLEASVVWW